MPEHFAINGLGGERKLEGVIRVNGAKNAALKVLAASVLFSDAITLENVPAIEDIRRMIELLEFLGFSVLRHGASGYTIMQGEKIKTELSAVIAEKFRASIVLAGPLLSRFGKVTFFFPGGCMIGKRPIDFFIEGFEAMGALVRVSASENTVEYCIEAKEGKLHGASIFLRAPSVTATETFMMAAVLAEGKTILKNAAMEPEIVSLAEFLNSAGAQIEGAGTPTITIVGGTLLSGKNCVYKTLPDRIEAGSFIILAALAGRDVTVADCDPLHLDALLSLLEYAGVSFTTGADFVRVFAPKDLSIPYRAFSIKTQGYPGFPTDLQAPITLFLTQAKGESSVFETIFESRLGYIKSLKLMGADIRATENQAFIEGPTQLVAREVESHDLRAGIAFLIAAIIAKGDSIVHNAYNIDRGYERIEDRLSSLGVSIQRVSL